MRQITEDQARRIYPGFEHFVVDVDEIAPIEDFGQWCRDEGLYEFVGFPSVWGSYELFCVESGTLPFNQQQFKKHIRSVARVIRPSTKRGKSRPTRYALKADLRIAA